MMADPTTCYADDCENPSTHGIHILWTIGSQVSRYACCEHVMAVLCEAVEESDSSFEVGTVEVGTIERLTICPDSKLVEIRGVKPVVYDPDETTITNKLRQ